MNTHLHLIDHTIVEVWGDESLKHVLCRHKVEIGDLVVIGTAGRNGPSHGVRKVERIVDTIDPNKDYEWVVSVVPLVKHTKFLKRVGKVRTEVTQRYKAENRQDILQELNIKEADVKRWLK